MAVVWLTAVLLALAAGFVGGWALKARRSGPWCGTCGRSTDGMVRHAAGTTQARTTVRHRNERLVA